MIISLQVLGQVAFDFRLSIAQILVALLTSAALEFAIAFRRQHVIMWPASALLTGNGVAFVLRVPGTEHGDWWSLRGWWIFARPRPCRCSRSTSIRVKGRHVFNPSNFGLVLCFLVLGSSRAEPLDFWWAPMSDWMLLALAIIVAGGFAILARLRLLGIAVLFWLTFAAGIGVLALSGHEMTARWHLGPITGGYFWWVLVTSPELLVFLFFMITDPKTIPSGRFGAPALRRRHRACRDAPDRPTADGVRDQGRAPRGARDRLRSAGAARARARGGGARPLAGRRPAARHQARHGRRRADRGGGVRRPAAARGHSCADECRRNRRRQRHAGTSRGCRT